MSEKKPVTYIEIHSEYEGQRIDNFLFTHLKNMPKTRIYRILRKGEVRVNKKRAKPSYRLQTGDAIRLPPMTLDIPRAPLKPNQSLLDELRERILYEDDFVIIVNKPAGIPVHGGTGVKLALIEAFRVLYPKLPHLELAHRLDVGTSGCLILAKKRSVLRQLHELLRSGTVQKIYWTLTKGRWNEKDYRVDAPLQKNHLSSGERMVRVHPEGKESLTVFKPLKEFKNASLMEATLHTGRTHQIRVHAAHKRHPIAGDEKYGDREFNKEMREKGLKRVFLHSHSVAFVLGEASIKAIAPLDESLEEVVGQL